MDTDRQARDHLYQRILRWSPTAKPEEVRERVDHMTPDEVTRLMKLSKTEYQSLASKHDWFFYH